VIICLERGADCLHMVQLMPLHPKTPSCLASFKSRLVLHFWYWLTQAVLEKRPLSGSSSSSSSSNQTTSCIDTATDCFFSWLFSVPKVLTLIVSSLSVCWRLCIADLNVVAERVAVVCVCPGSNKAREQVAGDRMVE